MQRASFAEMLINAGNLVGAECCFAMDGAGRDLGLVLDTTTGEDVQFRVQGGLFNGNNDL